MNIKSILISSLLMASSCSAIAQYYLPENNNWVMGNKTGLSFNSNSLTVLSTSISSANEGSASVSDSLGNLLFYTNGSNVWNNQHQLMPNGSSINGSGTQTASTTQPAVIIPHPSNTNLYYLFSLTAASNSRLFVNVIDMSLGGGKGNIDVSFPYKQIMIANQLAEKMTAVPACNNTVWLVTRSLSANAFLAYKIDANGLDTVPVVSNVGNLPADYYAQGVLKSNHNGTRLMTSNFKANLSAVGLEVYHFDGNTGIVSNAQIIDSINTYGGTFSPDGTKIYAQQITSPGSVYQYDLNQTNPFASKTFLGYSGQYADMQLGPDGKIYVASHIQSPGFNSYRYFARINNPNVSGTLSSFQDSVSNIAFLNANQSAGVLTQGLPNTIVKPLRDGNYMGITHLDTVVCGFDSLGKYLLNVPHHIHDFTWENNDTSRVREIHESGEYYISYSVNCGIQTDTFRVKSSNISDILLTYTLSEVICNSGFASYQWYLNDVLIPNATNSRVPIQGDGVYKVVVKNDDDCTSSADIQIHTGTNSNNILKENVLIYPNPATDYIYIKSDNEIQEMRIMDINGRIMKQDIIGHQIQLYKMNIAELQNGMYILNILFKNGNTINHKLIVQHK